MQEHQRQFIELMIQYDALRFGEFTLKSGRISPYFFNIGNIHSGTALAQIGDCYAHTLKNSDIDFDVLFGPAYKGIPLAATTAVSLATTLNQPVDYCFNRKEAKDHGEGGQLVGADLKDKRVVIIDDVITAGTAIRASLPLLKDAGATVAGIVIALDRQERGQGSQSALQEITQELNIPVISIISLADIVDYLETDTNNNSEILTAIANYQQQYGCTEAA